ncbi:MAG: hypothetical protein WDW38_005963 [Sanguina aurantia]
MQATMMMKKASSAVAARPSRASRSTTVRVNARAGNWLPGADAPTWLPDSAPGNFGFDPLGFSKDPNAFKRFQVAELIHARWAMLGSAGIIAVELFGFGSWYDAPTWAVTGGKPTYAGVDVPFDFGTLTAIEIALFAVVEGLRNEETDQEKKRYPGGAFDPLGLARDPKKADELKLKELKNGRLAMLSVIGFVAQHAANDKSPLAVLGEHISNPWGDNFATNGVSLPF